MGFLDSLNLGYYANKTMEISGMTKHMEEMTEEFKM